MVALVNGALLVEGQRMSEDTAVPDRLSRAIVDFRGEVLLWIDTTLVRLREREQQESLAVRQPSAPATLTRSVLERDAEQSSPSSRVGTSLSGGGLEPVIRREMSRDTEAINGRASPGDPPRPPIVECNAGTGTVPQSPPLDSLKRLDALARLLDQRLKVSQEEASNSFGASGEVGKSKK